MNEVLKRTAKADSKKVCLHPSASPSTCDPQIIRAHTLQRSGTLSLIARNGQVVEFMPHIPTLSKTGGKLLAKEVGVGIASTFTGFCKTHDNEFFSPIEDQEFVSTDEQLLLLTYRSLAMEHYKKAASIEKADIIKDLATGRPILDQLAYEEFAADWAEGNSRGFQDMRFRMGKIAERLAKKRDLVVHAYGLDFVGDIALAATGVFTPDRDFEGNALGAFDNEWTTAPCCCFSILPGPNGPRVIWTWTGKSEAVEQFIDSLKNLDPDLIGSATVQFCFASLENVFGAPTWWDQLPKDTQTHVEALALSDPYGDENVGALIPDGRSYVNWALDRAWSN